MLSIWMQFELSPIAAPLLLAARRPFRGVNMPWVVFGSLAVAAIVALWLFTRWWLGEGLARRRNSPRALFTELCRAHALASSERQLLLALADAHQLAQPGELFVNPSHFEESRLTPMLFPRRTELLALRARLFAGLEEPVEQPVPDQNASPALN
jgi:hypothetical protein